VIYVKKLLKVTLAIVFLFFLARNLFIFFCVGNMDKMPFSDSYFLGKRPCDQPDTVWQSEDGILTINGSNSGELSYGQVIHDNKIIKLYILFGEWDADVFEYIEGYNEDDYYQAHNELLNSGEGIREHWYCTFKGNGKEFIINRNADAQIGLLDILFENSDEIKVHRIE